jgi:hypothetical protein
MIKVAIRQSFQPALSENDLRAAEQQLRIELPRDYRAFLLAHNGGRPMPNRFPIIGNRSGNQGILDWLFGLHTDRHYNLLRTATAARGRVPSDLLPIGEDPGGNLICLSISGPNRNKVFFWTLEDEVDEDEPPAYSNVYFVANNFTELLGSLTDPPTK